MFGEDFLEWLKGDDVIKVGRNSYLEQTTRFNKTFTLSELNKFFIREYSI